MDRIEKSNGVSPLFQGISIFISAVIIVALCAGLLRRFCSREEPPHILEFTPETVAALKKGPTPIRVKVGLSISDFAEFDFAANKFKVDAIVWFYCDPKEVSVDTLGKFSFVRGEIEEKSEPHTYMIDSKQIVQYSVKVSFKTNLYYGYYPFEDHKLYLALINNAVSPEQLIFEASKDDFIIATEKDISEWRYYDKKVHTGSHNITISAGEKIHNVLYPEVIFEIDYFQYSIRHITMIILPLVLIFFMDLFSLCLDSAKNQSTLIQLSTTNITALVAYRFVIEAISPKIGYTTLADYLFFLFLGIATFMFFVNIVGPQLSVMHKKIIGIGLQVVVLAAFVYLFKVWPIC
jgi:hypothetical protein